MTRCLQAGEEARNMTGALAENTEQNRNKNDPFRIISGYDTQGDIVTRRRNRCTT
jgi:hypothetical protein